MRRFACKTCGGLLQATVDGYYNVDWDSGRFEPANLGVDVKIYCENDHEGEDTGFQLGPDDLSVVPIEE